MRYWCIYGERDEKGYFQWWSNTTGWGDLTDATMFDDRERNLFVLPQGAEAWELMIERG